MRFFVEVLDASSAWSRIQGSYPPRLALARDLIAKNVEARVRDVTGWQLFPAPNAQQHEAPSSTAALADLSTVGATSAERQGEEIR